ncbi:MAG: lysophospholipid acyltransferase family protein [Maricaulaceae bacterium]
MSAGVAQTARWRAEAFAWDCLQAGLGGLSLDAASAMGGAIMSWLGPFLPWRHVALRNLALAFPDHTTAERRAVVAKMWDNLGRLAGEFPHTPRLDPYAPDSRVTVEGRAHLDAVRESGRGAVFASGHFANWEVMAAAITRAGVTCHVTYRAANNPLIDQRIIDQRQAYGVRLQSPKGRRGGRQLMSALARGESIALMVDQKYTTGVETPFFGRPAMTNPAAVKLALHYGAPLIPMSARRLRGARFLVTVHPPLEIGAAKDEASVLDGARRLTQFIEAEIRAAPEQWLWIHRRFDKSVYTGRVDD